MPVRINREYEISCGHHLPFHEGKCREPHGHNYLIQIALLGTELIKEGPSMGMVLDFGDLDKEIKPILDLLDHKNLNETPYFTEGSHYFPPTAENIGLWLWDQLVRKFPTHTGLSQAAELDEVKVWETKRSHIVISTRWH